MPFIGDGFKALIIFGQGGKGLHAPIDSGSLLAAFSDGLAIHGDRGMLFALLVQDLQRSGGSQGPGFSAHPNHPHNRKAQMAMFGISKEFPAIPMAFVSPAKIAFEGLETGKAWVFASGVFESAKKAGIGSIDALEGHLAGLGVEGVILGEFRPKLSKGFALVREGTGESLLTVSL